MKKKLCLLLCSMSLLMDANAMPDKEIPTITKVAIENRLGLEDTIMLLAMRDAENGSPGNEYGVKAAKNTNLYTQASYAARSIRLNRSRYVDFKQGKYEGSQRVVHYKPGVDFVTFMGEYGGPTGYGWCPTNKNWADMVRSRMKYYKKEIGKWELK